MQPEQLDLFTAEFDQDEKPQVKPVKSKRKRESQYKFDLMDALRSPVITWRSPWQECIPEHVLQDISLARLVALIKGMEMATIPEAVAYLMPRSSEASMSREWVNIYLYAGREYMINFQGMAPDSLEFVPSELDEYEQSLLLRLRRWIWEKRRSTLKERNRASKRAEKGAADQQGSVSVVAG